MILDVEETFSVGEQYVADSVRSAGDYGVVFEDDGKTGYFYLLAVNDGNKVLDALHIYNVEQVIDKHIPSAIQLVWTDTWSIACLLINGYCHAIFDISRRFSYCKTGFPDSHSGWAANTDRKLDDKLFKEILSKGDTYQRSGAS